LYRGSVRLDEYEVGSAAMYRRMVIRALQDTAVQLADEYDGPIKVEVDIDQTHKSCKIRVTEFHGFD
jgi:hypothetical protein